MSESMIPVIYEALRQLTADNKNWLEFEVEVKTLTPVEAIGAAGDWDYPLLRGKEILLQARIGDSFGQAFTNSPAPFKGTVSDIIGLDLNKPENWAILIASLNALLRDQGLIKKTVHCRNSDPEECGKQVASFLKEKHNPEKIGIAGYQPALVSAIIDLFGADRVMVTDLDAGNLGKSVRNVEIWDGMAKTDDLISRSDLLLVTGSVFANDTAAPYYRAVLNGKPILFFGTTVSGIAHLLGLPHICPLGS